MTRFVANILFMGSVLETLLLSNSYVEQILFSGVFIGDLSDIIHTFAYNVFISFYRYLKECDVVYNNAPQKEIVSLT